MMRWSISAHNAFRRCQRQYFFGQIMASHNAKDDRRREAYILKQLTGLKAWQGILVHKGIQHFVIPTLTGAEPLDIPRTVEAIREMGQRQLAFSEERRYRHPGTRKSDAGLSYAALYEHEYGEGVDSSYAQQVWTIIDMCLRNLANLANLIEKIRRSRWVKPEVPLSFEMDGVTISAKLDLLLFDDDCPFVIDWKVSQSEASSYSRQSQVYGLSVLRRWSEFQPQDIRIVEVNLLRDMVKQHLVTEQSLLETEDFIFRSIGEIMALTGDRAYEEQQFEDYEPARTHRTCHYCNYRSLCLEMSNEISTNESVRNQEPTATQLPLPFIEDHRAPGW